MGRYEFYLISDKQPIYHIKSKLPQYYTKNVIKILGKDYTSIYNTNNEKLIDIKPGTASVFEWEQPSSSITDCKTGANIEVICRNYKGGHWFANYNQSRYDIYLHGREKKSLYKNNEQVAKIGMANSGYFIVSNNDEDPFFLIALFIVFKIGEDSIDNDLILEIYEDEKTENSRWVPVR